MMHHPFFVEHRIFIRVIGGSGVYQRRDQTGFAAEAPARYNDRHASNTDYSGVNKNLPGRRLGNKKLQVRFKSVNRLFHRWRFGYSLAVGVNMVRTTPLAATGFLWNHERIQSIDNP